MASSFNGNTALLADVAPVTAAPLTMACWFIADDLVGAHGLLSLSRAGVDTSYITLRAAGDVAGDPIRYIAADGLGGFVGLNTTTSYAPGRWHHAACVYASPTSHAVHLDGAGKATSSVGVTPPSLAQFGVGAFHRASVDTFCRGRIACPALWNAALTDPEIAALAAGTPPWLVRPASLVEYWPLLMHENRRAVGARRALVLNASSTPTTWSNDPPLHEASTSAARHRPDWIGRLAVGASPRPRPKRWYPGLGSSGRH